MRGPSGFPMRHAAGLAFVYTRPSHTDICAPAVLQHGRRACPPFIQTEDTPAGAFPVPADVNEAIARLVRPPHARMAPHATNRRLRRGPAIQSPTLRARPL